MSNIRDTTYPRTCDYHGKMSAHNDQGTLSSSRITTKGNCPHSRGFLKCLFLRGLEKRKQVRLSQTEKKTSLRNQQFKLDIVLKVEAGELDRKTRARAQDVYESDLPVILVD